MTVIHYGCADCNDKDREIERLRQELKTARVTFPGDLRAAGWTVAVHNDYRQDGVPHTFWLLTHPDGRWLKGEGENDAEALNVIRGVLGIPS